MLDKRLKRLLIIICIIIILIIMIIGIKKYIDYRKNQEPFAYEIEKRERIKAIQDGEVTGKYSSNVLSDEYVFLDQEDRKVIDVHIDNLIRFVNDPEMSVNHIWQHYLTEDYKKQMFSSSDINLLKYLNENFPAPHDYHCINYEIKENELYAHVASQSAINGQVKTIKIVNYDQDQENRWIYFGDLKSIKNVRMVANTKDIYITSDSIMHYGDYSVLMLNIENLTDKDVTVDFAGSYLMKEEGRNYQNYTLYDDGVKPVVTIKAKEKIQYELKFNQFVAYAEKAELMMEINGEKLELKEAFITTNRTITD